MTSDRVKAGCLAVGLLISAFLTSIFTPLLYDSLNPTHSPWVPSSQNGSALVTVAPSRPAWHTIDPIVCITVSMWLDVVVLGVALLYVRLRRPESITEREMSYPKRYFVTVGAFQGLGGLFYQYSSPGDRTAPLFQPILDNSRIPITFSMRFLVLRKRPTIKKAVCAVAIFVAVTVSLIPTFISGLESEAARREEGGATGPWRVIWPLIRVTSFIPAALSAVTLERTVNDTVNTSRDIPEREPEPETDDRALLINSPRVDDDDSRELAGREQTTDAVDDSTGGGEKLNMVDDSPGGGEKLNMVYTLFWAFLMTVLTTTSLLWADLIPGFGLVAEPSLLGKQLWFNTRCMVGAVGECGLYVVGLFWGRMVVRTAQFVTRALLLRYGEGASFNTICMATVSPLTLLFWTLFDESPFRWHPHTSLSTWLSVGALVVIVPSLVLYSHTPREKPQENTAQ